MRNIHAELDEKFLQTRFDDHRLYTANMWTLAVFIVGGLWEWDWVVDPVHAPNTLDLRIAMALGAAALAIFYRHATRGMAVIEGSFTLVLFNCVYYVILTRLQGGMVYGIGGFMFTQMAGLVVLRGFAFRHTVLIHVAASLAPHAMGLVFPESGFMHTHYAALLWPATLMAVIAHHGLFNEYVGAYTLKMRLHQMAEVDSFTGVLNRRALSERAQAAIALILRRQQPLAVLMLDLDKFKSVNDTYGHMAGDRLLMHIVRTIQGHLRNSDLLCRWGGEEFLIVMPDAGPLAAHQKAEQLRQAVACDWVDVGGGRAIQVTVSVGVAHLRDRGDALDDVIRRADAMMYRAKTSGRNRVCVDG